MFVLSRCICFCCIYLIIKTKLTRYEKNYTLFDSTAFRGAERRTIQRFCTKFLITQYRLSRSQHLYEKHLDRQRRYNLAYGGNTNYFTISTDKGNTWTISQAVLPDGILVADLCAVSANIAYIAANDFNNG